MSFRLLSHNRLLLLLLLSTMLPLRAGAQYDDTTIASGHRTIAAGDVLEIMGISGEPDAKFEWILTTGGSFIEAGREKLFRTRLTQEGAYILDGQFTDVTGIRRLHMTIDVTAPLEEQPQSLESAAGKSGLNIVSLDMSADNSAARLNRDSSLLTLTVSQEFVNPIAGDLDTQQDTDGDGDPGNDNDLSDTLFSTEHNTLHLWFASPDAATTIALSTDAEDGTPIRQEIAVTSGDMPLSTGNIDAGVERQGTVSFSFPLDAWIDPATIVYEWNFGDGWRSMADKPTHQYFQSGRYDVNVVAREMSTGRILANGEETVEIIDAPKLIGNVSSSASSAAPKMPSSEPRKSGGSFFWTLVRILGVLLAAAALGAGSVWGLRKFPRREGALQKALEAAESKLLTPSGIEKETSNEEPAVLQLKRPDAPESHTLEASPRQNDREPDSALPALALTSQPLQDAPAPEWLHKGLVQAENKQKSAAFAPEPAPATMTVGTSSPSPTPPPIFSFPEEAMPPPLQNDQARQQLPDEHSPIIPAAEPEQSMSEDDMLPPWLKEDETKATEGTEGDSLRAERLLDQTEGAVIGPNNGPTASEISTDPELEATEAEDSVTVISDQTTAISPSIASVSPAPEPKTALALPAVMPSLESSAPSPTLSAIVAPPVPVSTSSTQLFSVPSPGANDHERLERELERKRRKRKRHRKNVKKRKEAGTDAVTSPAHLAAAPSPNPVPGPNASAPSPKPVEKDIPHAQPTTAQTPISSDKVAFMIKAEGLERKNGAQKGT